MNKQFLNTLSSKLSSKATKLGNYLVKERMIPPQNFTRYSISGFITYSVYSELNDLSKPFLKLVENDNKSITKINGIKINLSNENALNFINISISGSVGLMAWYAPYIIGSIFIFNNYKNYSDSLRQIKKYITSTDTTKVESTKME